MKECKITNNTTDSVVVIIPSIAQNAEVTYNQDLIELEIKDDKNAKITEIPPGKSGTVILDQTFDDSGTKKYSLNYNLLIS
ncbi:hypothetical protein, partial [Xanthovirga aplysinae]|uniref:hypothetical protein n=1 Tax=Xanthovirga aplysinae TaxID=2529853 RepID=UPI001CA39ACE